MSVTRYFNQRDELPENPDIFVYDTLPAEFRVKVSLAIADMWDVHGQQSASNRKDPQDRWVKEMLRSLGVRNLPHRTPADCFDALDVNGFFHAVEVALSEASSFAKYGTNSNEDKRLARAALRVTVHKLNTYMNFHAVGYQVEEGDYHPPFRVIRRDTQYTHNELVRPALGLLSDKNFAHVDKQFRDAHHEYLQGNYADAITDAASAVESFLKVILGVSEGTLSQLLDEAGKQGYFPTYLEGSVGQWKTLMLSSGNVRNKEGDAHGKDGKRLEDRQLERYARYTLNLSASNMLFIADEYKTRN